MKKIKIIFISSFLIFIAILLMNFNRIDECISIIDNRYLTKKADIYNYNSFNNYISDRIGYREKMIEVYQFLNKALFNTFDNEELFIGKDGHYFPKIERNVTYNDYHEDFAIFVEKLNDYCQERNIKFYFMFDPSKISVYSEYLPEGVNYDDSWVDSFLMHLKDHGVNVVDNLNYFRSIKDENAIYNSQYDVAHWNDLGAFLGTNNLLETIKKDFPNIEILDENDYTIFKEEVKHLPASLIKTNEKIDKFVFEERGHDLSDEYIKDLNIAEEFNHFTYYLNNNELPNALFFEGSYYNSSDRDRFNKNNFNRYVAVHNYRNIENFDYYIEAFNPDIVVFEVAEYTFKEYYFSQWGMQHKEVIEAFDLGKTVVESENVVDIKMVEKGEYIEITVSSLPENTENCYLSYNGEILDLHIVGDNIYNGYIDARCFDDDLTTVIYSQNGQYFRARPNDALFKK